MTNGNDPAFAHEGAVISIRENVKAPYLDEIVAIKQKHEGLTKREYFAAMALNGILASGVRQNIDGQPATVYQAAIFATDALIAALNEPVK